MKKLILTIQLLLMVSFLSAGVRIGGGGPVAKVAGIRRGGGGPIQITRTCHVNTGERRGIGGTDSGGGLRPHIERWWSHRGIIKNP